MRKMNTYTHRFCNRMIIHFLIYLCIFFCGIAISIQVLLITPLFTTGYYAHIYNNVDEKYDLFLDSQVAHKNAQTYIEFITTTQKSTTLPVTQREFIHMRDVQALYQTIGQLVFDVFVCTVFSILLFFSKQKTRTFFSSNIHSLKTAFFVFAVASIGILIALSSFSFFWEALHHIFFQNDLWLLDYRTITIQTFPESFFISFFVGISLLTSLLYWTISFILHYNFHIKQ